MQKLFVSRIAVAVSASTVFALIMASSKTEEAVADLYLKVSGNHELLGQPVRAPDGTVPGCAECQREETNREGREEGSESYEELMIEGDEENTEILEGTLTENETEENADEGTENTEEEENRAEPEAIEDQREAESVVDPIEVEAEQERIGEENQEESLQEETDEDLETVETTFEVLEDARELREPVREMRETINEWDIFAASGMDTVDSMPSPMVAGARGEKVNPAHREFPVWVNKVLIPVVDALVFETVE